ncbi:C2 domain-containing protein [Dictyostelium discoideum AX4]|uniref:C2 domain-containing protein n=1 Tax=Dictyostelium discoideum TaxID=44689 RepID=Q54FM5_DICDI|nr:C2 domain-containing protein [Dictyostelium discoideum AX4]EAL62062.1 C2 domain-containing protein [Dictyostelium discoideum AX4]|eukprot:XP_635566.1 C2 domain-containing protein [Dictyostelium discoideum AX4]
MSGDLYLDMLATQVNQGNMGGKGGPFGYLWKEKNRKDKKKDKTPKPKKQEDYTVCDIHIGSGSVRDAKDSNGLADPFVMIWSVNIEGDHDKCIYKSKVCKETLTPNWNEDGELKMKNGSYRECILELWDHDTFTANDFIGRALIFPSSVTFGMEYKENVKVFDKDDKTNPTGTVEINIKRK